MEGAWHESLRDAEGDMHRALIEVNVLIAIWYAIKMKHVYAPRDLGIVEVDPLIGVGDIASKGDAVVLFRDYYHFTREIKYRILAKSKLKCTWMIRAVSQLIDKNTLLFSYEPLGTDEEKTRMQVWEEEPEETRKFTEVIRNVPSRKSNFALPEKLSLVDFSILTDEERRKIYHVIINKLNSLLPNISRKDLVYATLDILFILEVKKIFDSISLEEAEEISHDEEISNGTNVKAIKKEWGKRKGDLLRRLPNVTTLSE
jgi:hypothetical protein